MTQLASCFEVFGSRSVYFRGKFQATFFSQVAELVGPLYQPVTSERAVQVPKRRGFTFSYFMRQWKRS